MPAGLEACCARGQQLMVSLEAQLGRSSAQLASAAALLEELPAEGAARGDALLELLHAWQVHAYRQLLLADLRACLGAVQLLQQEERRLVAEVGDRLPLQLQGLLLAHCR
jgi:hypothetical protein